MNSLLADLHTRGVTCVVTLPLVQREDGSSWGEEGKRTGLEERQPRHKMMTLLK